MRRWLVVTLALLLAAGALYGLASSGHHDHAEEIDAASRQKLLDVLADESP